MALLFKNILFTLIVPGTVGVYLPLLIAGGSPRSGGGFFVVAFLVLAAGAGLYTWCVWNFAVRGRGTPAPIDAPKKLVVRGPYRFSRNPMYVSVLAVIFGWALLFAAVELLVYGLSVMACFQLFIVLYEEPRLRREFSSEYETYCARVGRWLPGLRGRGA